MDVAKYQSELKWVASQRDRMLPLIESWANCNTGSDNLKGLNQMVSILKQAFEPLGTCTLHSLPERLTINELGETISAPIAPALTVRGGDPEGQGPKVLLSGHMDTVFSIKSGFQTCRYEGENRLIGPGVIDLKGGLVLMLIALEALNRSEWAHSLSWQVVVNPDEEVGSVSSTSLLTQLAHGQDVALVFEPPYPDGTMVSERKGSANYAIHAKGKAAHAGRAFHEGLNAITALSRVLVSIDGLNSIQKDITVNIGTIRGGEAANIVPDRAVAQVGIRASTTKHMELIESKMSDIVQHANEQGKATITLQQLSYRPPKSFNRETKHLFECLQSCAQKLKQKVTWQSSGGVCDGNTLAAAGVPVIDTLGAPGGAIHTDQEYLSVNELVPRAQLVTLYLLTLASRAWTPLSQEGKNQ